MLAEEIGGNRPSASSGPSGGLGPEEIRENRRKSEVFCTYFQGFEFGFLRAFGGCSVLGFLVFNFAAGVGFFWTELDEIEQNWTVFGLPCICSVLVLDWDSCIRLGGGTARFDDIHNSYYHNIL
jgi:hypothetical protein